MTVKMRSFNWEKDFESVRSFLAELYTLTNSLQNWIPSRFENRKFGPCGTEYQDEEDNFVKIWEDKSKSPASIVAVTTVESNSYFWIHIHPKYNYLEKEIIHWIEHEEIVNLNPDLEKQEIHIYVVGNNENRISLLEELEYQDLGLEEYTRWRDLSEPVPEYTLPANFTIRNVNIKQDFKKYREVIASVFKHCSKMTKNLFDKFTTASFYNEDLDIVTVAPNGDFAAFCTIRLDPMSKIAELEPVGTHPQYRKLGLANAVICEGLKRLKQYDPKVICIPGAAAYEAANRLYDSLGFTNKDEVHIWKKIIEK